MNSQTATRSAPLTPRSTRMPWPVWAMVALALVSLAAVGWQRIAAPPVADVATDVAWQRALHFEDRPNGDVAVLDARDRREVARFSGEQGFLRGALRTLARERLRRGLGPTEPFVLTGHDNGRMTLSDPSTGTRIPIESFGPSNVAVFAPLRDAGRAPRQP
ncbi:MAG: photosynthetic complex assembly protein PuhC [Ramlibacter sp.]